MEDQFGNIISYVLKIPNAYLNPDDPDEICTFTEGDNFLIRYSSPVEKGLGVGIGKMYLETKPVNPTIPKAEILLINASSTENYDEFMTPYNYNISLDLTPFDTEFMGTYKSVKFNLNLSVLASYAKDSYIDFSNLLISSYDPSYELTIDQIIILRESSEPTDLFEFSYERVWQFTQLEEITSGADPSQDKYSLSLEEEPIFYNYAEEGKWLEYLKIYDDNYNYYSAGISGDEYQILWSPITQNFTWNEGFDKFQDYWGMQIELPHMVAPNTTLFFEYCTNESWNNPINLYYENIDFDTLEITYDYDYWLTPRYEEWYGEIIENSDFDYEFVQYYSESFTVYTETDEYSHIFDVDYDFIQDFVNLSLFKVIGLYANFTDEFIEDDDTNFDFIFDLSTKNFTVRDLNSEDGLLNIFDSITVVLNFTSGPISTSSQIILSQSFNETYILDIEDTFYDFLSISFDYSMISGEYLFAEDSETIVSSYSSFEPINFTRNSGINNIETSSLFTKFELFEDPFSVIYVADIDMDNKVDYKHEMDVDKDGTIDITRYGIDDEENPDEIIWYTVVQDYESTQTLINMSLGDVQSTKWFDLDDESFSSYQFSLTINPLDWLVSIANRIMPDMDFWARKFVQQQYYESQNVTTKFYSVRIDEDRDGYADQEIAYESSEIVIDYEITNCESALVAAKPMNALLAIIDYASKSFTALFEGHREDPIFNDQLSETILKSTSLLNSKFDPITASVLDSSYHKFTKNMTTSYTVRNLSESITVTDWEENEIVETRIYSDDFNTENTIDTNLRTIDNLDTAQQVEAPADLFTSEAAEIEVWGVDDISTKFDSLTVISEGYVSTTNYYEQQNVKIIIPNRFSAFDDSFKGDKNNAKGDVTFEVTGIFITPRDGVYYTADKDAFISGSARVDGSYLFYDSTGNGFCETVYILSATPNEDGAYTVMSIGFNYDGQHEFSPYTKTEFTESVPETDLDEFLKVNKIFGANWMYHFSTLENNELLFPPDLYDGYEQKDSIFEIYKITDTVSHYPELFYEIRHKSYDNAWAVHSDNLLIDIQEQVTMMLTATGISATVQALAAATVVLAPIANFLGAVAYASTYALMTKFSIDVKMHKADSEERSRTFYPEGSDRRAPTSLNQRMLTDSIFKDSMPAALMGHPGAYYTTITGGTIGNEYTAQVIASPPNDMRWTGAQNLAAGIYYATAGVAGGNPDAMTCLDFDDLNLDYLLLTSELNSYNNRPYYSYQTGDGYVSPTHNALYYDYRSNSLGYAQLAVSEATGGKLDSIVLKSVYNDHLGYSIPQYMFVDKDTDHNQLVLPQSTLYRPLVLSKERYDDLPSKPAEGQISVDVKCKFAPESAGIDPYNMSIFEKEKDYFAKIPLADGRFLYPITSVTILVIDRYITKEYSGQYPNIVEFDVVHETVIETIDYLVEGRHYELEGGNLYFKRPIDDFCYSSAAMFNKFNGEPDTFYRVQINSERVVAADPNSQYYDEYMELALHQASSHVLQDFVNVHTHAQVAGSMTAEIGYTMVMTAITTSLSVALIAFGSWAAKGTEGYFQTAGLLASKAQLVGQIAKQVGKSVVSEMFEEVVLDGLIESLSENIVPMLGGTEDMAFWVSSLVTSVRETGSSTGRANMQQQAQVNQDLRNWIATRQSQARQTGALSTELRKKLYNEYKSMQSLSAIEQRASMSQFKKLATSKSFKLLSLAIPSMFFGGLTLIGSIQIATAFGSKVISTPKTISQYYTSIQQGIAERRNIRDLAGAAGLSAQQLKTVWTEHMGYSSTSIFPQSNPNLKSNAKTSVDNIVNDKLGEITPTSLEAMSMFGAFSAQAYVASEFEETLSNLEDKEHVIEENTANLETMRNCREDREEMIENVQENFGEETIPLDISNIPDQMIKVGAIDPLFLLLAKHASPLKQLFPPAHFTIEELRTWLANRYGITYKFDLYYGTYLIDVDQKIGTLDITESTTIEQILQEINYNVVNPDELLTLKPEEEFFDNWFTQLKGISGTGEIWTLLTRSEKVEFYGEFESLCSKIRHEIEFASSDIYDIAYQYALNEFLSVNDKYTTSIDIDTGKEVKILDQEWRGYLVEKVWKYNYKEKMMQEGVFIDSYKGVIDNVLQGVVFKRLIENARDKKVLALKNYDVISSLTELIKDSGIVRDLINSYLFNEFTLETLAQTFLQWNAYKIAAYASQTHTRNGVLSEVISELLFFSAALSEIYDAYRSKIVNFPIPIFSYEFTIPEKLSAFIGPHLKVGSDLRFLDLFGIRYFLIEEGSSLKRVGLFSTVKHSIDINAIVKDAVSGVYVYARENIDKGIVQSSELYTYPISLSYKSGITLDKLIEIWFDTHYDKDLSHLKTIKGSRRDMFESDIIKAINSKIWNKKGKSLSKESFVQGIKEFCTGADFIQSNIINMYKVDSSITTILTFIEELADNIDSSFTKIGIINSEGDFETRMGLVRNVKKSDYFITGEELNFEQLVKLGITEIYQGKSLVHNLGAMDSDSLKNKYTEKQYRIITKNDGKSKALIEVTGERIQIPNGYVDGLVVDDKIILNALLTYVDGRCLLSEFFDPDLIPFEGLEFSINDQFWRNYENHINNEYANIYTVFSFSEGELCRDVGAIVHLSDPALRSDNLKFHLPQLSALFKSTGIVSSKRALVKKKVDQIFQCDPFHDKDSVIVYGNDFTKDIFMQIFYDLFDPYTQFYKQRTQTLALKFLSHLNGISYGTKFEEFKQGPGLSEINIALKKLSFTKAELQALIWKKVDSRTGELVFKYEQTNKEWLKLLYDKITGYIPNDGSVFAQQRDKLKGLGSEYDKIDDSSIARNREEFTIEEAKMGREIFESAKAIFGHFTIRLMFANMIDYYGSKGSFGIKIVNRLTIEIRDRDTHLPLEERQDLIDLLFNIGLIPSTFQYDRPVSMPIDVNLLFGFFFLESHIYLDIEGSTDVRSSDNTLIFSLGPLVALTPSVSFGGKNLRGLSKDIGAYLEISYESYRANNLDQTDVNILGKEFLIDQARTLDFIANKIKTTIIDGHYYMDNAKNIWLANKIIEHARLGLIYEKISTPQGYLRDQIETFMDASHADSKQNTLILKFNYFLPKSGKQFKLQISQNELAENVIASWASPKSLFSADYSNFRAQLLHQNSHNIRKYLKTLINILGTNEKVRVFPLLDRSDADTGYEFVTDSSKFDWKILPNGETYFDIDLNNEQDIYKLQHIINILYTGKFAFVVKKPTGIWNDGKMIFAFNRDGFLEPNELHSQNMRISGYSTVFKGDNDEWRGLWIYPKAWSTSNYAKNNDIRSYINYIKDPMLDKKNINAFMRKYMERMERLFPGYRLFMKNYLALI